jgi:hypothetical protein
MGLLRKLKQLTCGRQPIDNRPRPHPRPHQRPRQPSPSSQLIYGPLPDSFFQAVDAARQDSGYEPLPVLRQGSVKSLNQSRRDSSEQLHRLPPGTPIKFRRRPVSPELLRPRSSSASSLFHNHHHHSHSIPGSPVFMHQFDHDPMVEQVQYPHPSMMMMMKQSMPFFPPLQQQFHPMIHPHVQMPGQGWFGGSPMPIIPMQPFQQFY